MSCVAGFLDRPVIILRSLKLKNSTNNNNSHNDSKSKKLELDKINSISPKNIDSNLKEDSQEGKNILRLDPSHNIKNVGSNPENDFKSDDLTGELLESTDLFSDDYEGDTLICDKNEDFMCLNNPNLPCVLLKAVLVVLGIVETCKRSEINDDKAIKTASVNEVKVKIISEERKGKDNEENISNNNVTTTKGHNNGSNDEDFIHDSDNDEEDSFLSRLCSSTGLKGRGLEIVCCSELPSGSGK